MFGSFKEDKDMGYDMRLYVVEKFDVKGYEEETKDKRVAQIIASIELCSVDSEVSKFTEYPATDCYITVDGHNCLTDCYGKPLTEIPIDEAISTLQRGIAATNGYRRYWAALGLLQGLVLAGMNTEDFVVLQYGH